MSSPDVEPTGRHSGWTWLVRARPEWVQADEPRACRCGPPVPWSAAPRRRRPLVEAGRQRCRTPFEPSTEIQPARPSAARVVTCRTQEPRLGSDPGARRQAAARRRCAADCASARAHRGTDTLLTQWPLRSPSSTRSRVVSLDGDPQGVAPTASPSAVQRRAPRTTGSLARAQYRAHRRRRTTYGASRVTGRPGCQLRPCSRCRQAPSGWWPRPLHHRSAAL
jgi:hypothetical protein